jgi:predicted molibdopterin-dependent oxidoreductase YjgC
MRGAMKMAVFQESGFRPASWKERTVRTEAAMMRVAPMISNSFHGRSWAGRKSFGEGQAIMKRIKGIVPIGALNGQLSYRVTNGEAYFIQKIHRHVV